MSEHSRLRRRRVDDDEEQTAAATPPEHALLALQRSAGNQAVARLVHDKASKAVKVPKSYGDLKIPFDDKTKFALTRAPEDGDPTLSELVVKHKRDILDQMQTGLGVDRVSDMQVLEDAEMLELANGLVGEGESNTAELRRLVRVNARMHARLLSVGTKQQFWDPGEAAGDVVQLPGDYIAQEPDLPAKGTKLKDKDIVRSPVKGAKYWQYACVLIALVKQEGLEAVRRLLELKTAPKDLTAAVYALHDHYKEEGVEYDDGSSRRRVMGDFGYSMAFAGKSTWADLPTWMAFDTGKKYVFDITGHTVKVTPKHSIALGTRLTGTMKDHFTPESDIDNYTQDETTKTVEYVWIK